MRADRIVLVILSLLLSGGASALAQSPPARISVWDTGSLSVNRLLPEDLVNKEAWVKKSRNQKAPSFEGDAVIANGRILVVVRKQGSAVDVYDAASKTPVWRVQLRLALCRSCCPEVESSSDREISGP